MNEVKRAAIYSPEVDSYGIGLAYTFIVDHGLYLANIYTGKESLLELGADLAREYFDVIIVKNADVITEDTQELLDFGNIMPVPFIGAEDLYCTNENLDLETMQYELLDVSDPSRWKPDPEDTDSDAVVMVVEKRNRKFSMGVIPFGFEKVNGKFVPDPNTTPWVEKIFIKALEGERYTTIATWLDQEGVPSPRNKKSDSEKEDSRWSDNTIRDIPRNERYKQDGVISRELFDGVQARFSDHQEKLKAKAKSEENPRGPYQRLVYCESCGRHMDYLGVGVNRRKTAIYRCKYHTGKNPRSEAFDHMPTVTEEKLRVEVLRQCNDYIDYVSDNKNLIAVVDRQRKKMVSLEKQITSVGEKVLQKKDINNVDGLWNSWMAAKVRYSSTSGYAGIVQYLHKILHIGHMDEADLNTELKLIDSITVGPDGNVKVHFKGDRLLS